MLNSIKVDNTPLEIIPSNISVSYDNIHSTERALDGTLYADSDKKKQRLKVNFNLTTQDQFAAIQQAFEVNKESGIKVEYLDNRQAQFFVDDMTFDPWLIDSNLYWRNVEIQLLEI
jgi:hypothetical protein